MNILHIGVHENANRNSGDTVLFKMVRCAFDSLGDVDDMFSDTGGDV